MRAFPSTFPKQIKKQNQSLIQQTTLLRYFYNQIIEIKMKAVEC